MLELPSVITCAGDGRAWKNPSTRALHLWLNLASTQHPQTTSSSAASWQELGQGNLSEEQSPQGKLAVIQCSGWRRWTIPGAWPGAMALSCPHCWKALPWRAALPLELPDKATARGEVVPEVTWAMFVTVFCVLIMPTSPGEELEPLARQCCHL